MKVQHPTFPDVVQDVTNAKPWLKQGWLEYVEPVEVDAGQPQAETPQMTPPGPIPLVKPRRSRGRRNPEVKEASDGE